MSGGVKGRPPFLVDFAVRRLLLPKWPPNLVLLSSFPRRWFSYYGGAIGLAVDGLLARRRLEGRQKMAKRINYAKEVR